MKTILFVSACLSFGGSEKILSWFAERFAADGFNVHILDLKMFDNASDYHRDIDPSITIHELSNEKTSHLKRVFAISKLTKKIDAD